MTTCSELSPQGFPLRPGDRLLDLAALEQLRRRDPELVEQLLRGHPEVSDEPHPHLLHYPSGGVVVGEGGRRDAVDVEPREAHLDEPSRPPGAVPVATRRLTNAMPDSDSLSESSECARTWNQPMKSPDARSITAQNPKL